MPVYTAAITMPASTTLDVSGLFSRPARIVMAAVSTLIPTPALTKAATAPMPAASTMALREVETSHVYDVSVPMPATESFTVRGGRTVNVAINMAARGEMELSVCSAQYGLQVRDAIDAILQMWGVHCHGAGCDTPAAEEAVNCLNSAFQKLAASGKVAQFHHREPRSAVLTSGGSPSYSHLIEVDRAAQSVVAPVSIMIDGQRRLLRPLGSLSALRSFAEAYYTGSDAPLAYFVEMLEGASGTGMRIYLAPAPPTEAAATLEYDVILKPQRFSCQFPGVRLPVPHLYAETLLLPLAKWYALSSRYFERPEIKPAVEAQAAEVLTLLGEFSPRPKEVES